MGITHGAKGISFWAFCGHPYYENTEGWTQAYGQEVWQGYRQIGEELFGEEGMASALIYPSVTLDIMGERGVVSASNSHIHHIYKQTHNGQRYLIALNAADSTQSTVFTIEGLAAGTPIQVLFEDREITAGDGSLSDSFSALERHVYVLESAATRGGSQKVASPPTSAPGQTITYTVVVQDLAAPLTATVHLTDVVPTGLTYVSDTLTATAGIVSDTLAPTLRWTGTLTPTPVVTVTYAVTASATTAQVITNTAVIAAPGYQSVTRTATVQINRWSLYLPLVLRDLSPVSED